MSPFLATVRIFKAVWQILTVLRDAKRRREREEIEQRTMIGSAEALAVLKAKHEEIINSHLPKT